MKDFTIDRRRENSITNSNGKYFYGIIQVIKQKKKM